MATKLLVVAVSAQSPVYFLHVHKSGGTFMCHFAKQNGLAVSSHNCNVQTNQRCCGGNSASEHYRFAAATPYDFVANERYMYAAMATDAFTLSLIHISEPTRPERIGVGGLWL